MDLWVTKPILQVLVFVSLSAAMAARAQVTTEGDAILHTNLVRTAGWTGNGIRVGVISTGIVSLPAYQQAGDLPQQIYITNNVRGTLDEGDLMMEIIHQEAPNAQLGFCDGIDVNFYTCLTDLTTNFHADVVVDDLLGSGEFYPDETASLIPQLEAQNNRFIFVHLSGNEQDGGYWEGEFVPVPLTVNGTPMTVLDFGVANGKSSDPYNTVNVPPGANIVFFINWNDPPQGTNNDTLTAYFLNVADRVLAQQGPTPNANADPNIVIQYQNNSRTNMPVRLVVALTNQARSGELAVKITEGYPICNLTCVALTYSTPGDAGGGVGDLDDALVVGGTSINNPTWVVPLSNAGPYRLDFSATPDPNTPDGFEYTRLPAPVYFQKPDLVAPTCVTVPFSNGGAPVNGSFCGTSSAAPGIAGAVALLQSGSMDRTQILQALRATAHQYGMQSPWDPDYGYGLADAYAALQSVYQLPEPQITVPASFGVTINSGQSVNFAGNCTAGSGATIMGYLWDFGDGQTSTQQNPGGVVFSKGGNYTVTFNCVDSRGLRNGQPATVTVNVTGSTSSVGGGGGASLIVVISFIFLVLWRFQDEWLKNMLSESVRAGWVEFR